jgi:hypothetical protein
MRLKTAATVAILLVAAGGAFLRGDHLLGPRCGVAYAMVAAGLLWLFARSSGWRSIVIAAVAVPVAVVMADPASFNPDVQHFIDKHATDRAVRKELAAVFGSDPAYRDLSVSTQHLKVVNFTIRGSVANRADLDRLRERVGSECPTVGGCVLHWDVTTR